MRGGVKRGLKLLVGIPNRPALLFFLPRLGSRTGTLSRPHPFRHRPNPHSVLRNAASPDLVSNGFAPVGHLFPWEERKACAMTPE